jgi:hypothetical protein
MKRLLLWFLVSFVGTASVVGQAQEPGPGFRRIFVPEEQLPRLGLDRFLPIRTSDLLARLEQDPGAASKPEDTPRLVDAFMTARLVGNDLVSDCSRWRFEWDDEAPKEYLLQGEMAMQPMAASWIPEDGIDAIGQLTLTPEGTRRLRIDRSGDYWWGWSLRSQPNTAYRKDLYFRLSTPSSPRTRLILKLPASWTVESDQAVVQRVEEERDPLPAKWPSQDRDLRSSNSTWWQLDFSGVEELGLVLRPGISQREVTTLKRIDRHITQYNWGIDGLHLTSRWEVDSKTQSPDGWTLRLTSPLQILRLAWNDRPVAWTQQGDTLTILNVIRDESQADKPLESTGGSGPASTQGDEPSTIDPEGSGNQRLILEARTAIPAELAQNHGLWPQAGSPLASAPWVELEGAFIEEGASVIQGASPLAFQHLKVQSPWAFRTIEAQDSYSTTNGWITEWSGTAPSIQWQLQRSDMWMAIDQLTAFRLQEEFPTAIVAVEVQTGASTRSLLDFILQEGWTIQSAISLTPDVVATLDAAPSSGALRRLILDAPVSESCRLELQLAGAFNASDRDYRTIPLKPLLVWKEAIQKDTFWVENTGAFSLVPSPELFRYRIYDDDLPDWQRQRMPRLGDLWMLRPPAGFSGQLTVQQAPPTILTRTETSVTETPEGIGVLYSCEIQSMSGRVPELEIRWSQAQQAQVFWRIATTDQQPSSQRRPEGFIQPLDSSELAVRLPIQLSPSETIRLEGVCNLKKGTPQELAALPLPVVVDATPQRSLLRVDRAVPVKFTTNIPDLLPFGIHDSPDGHPTDVYRYNSFSPPSLHVATAAEKLHESVWISKQRVDHLWRPEGQMLHQVDWELEGRIDTSWTFRVPQSWQCVSARINDQEWIGRLRKSADGTMTWNLSHLPGVAGRKERNRATLEFVHGETADRTSEDLRNDGAPAGWTGSATAILRFATQLFHGSRLPEEALQTPVVPWPIGQSMEWIWTAEGYDVVGKTSERMNWFERCRRGLPWHWTDPWLSERGSRQVGQGIDSRATPDFPERWRSSDGFKPLGWVGMEAGRLQDSSWQSHAMLIPRCVLQVVWTAWALLFGAVGWRWLSRFRRLTLAMSLLVAMLWLGPASMVPFVQASLLGLWFASALRSVAEMIHQKSVSSDPEKRKGQVVLTAATTGILFLAVTPLGSDSLLGQSGPEGPVASRTSNTMQRLEGNPSAGDSTVALDPIPILIPIDTEGNAAGNHCYVPKELVERWMAEQRQPSGKIDPATWISARYLCEFASPLGAESTSRDQLTATLDVLVDNLDRPVSIPFSREAARLIRFQSNDYEVPIGDRVRWENGSLLWKAEREGRHRIKLVMQPIVSKKDDDTESLEVPVLPIATATIEVVSNDSNLTDLDVESIGQRSEPALGRITASLGPLDHLKIQWRRRPAQLRRTTNEFRAASWLDLTQHPPRVHTLFWYPTPQWPAGALEWEVSSDWTPVEYEQSVGRITETASGSSMAKKRYRAVWPEAPQIPPGPPGQPVLHTEWIPSNPQANLLAFPLPELLSGRLSDHRLALSVGPQDPWKIEGIQSWPNVDPSEWIGSGPFAEATGESFFLRVPPGAIPPLLRFQKSTPNTELVMESRWIFHPSVLQWQCQIESRSGVPQWSSIPLVIPGRIPLDSVRIVGRSDPLPAAWLDSIDATLIAIPTANQASRIGRINLEGSLPIEQGSKHRVPLVTPLGDFVTRHRVETYRSHEAHVLWEGVADWDETSPIRIPTNNELLAKLIVPMWTRELSMRGGPGISGNIDDLTARIESVARFSVARESVITGGRTWIRWDPSASSGQLRIDGELQSESDIPPSLLVEIPEELITPKFDCPWVRQKSSRTGRSLLLLTPLPQADSIYRFTGELSLPPVTSIRSSPPEIRWIESGAVHHYAMLPEKIEQRGAVWSGEGVRQLPNAEALPLLPPGLALAVGFVPYEVATSGGTLQLQLPERPDAAPRIPLAIHHLSKTPRLEGSPTADWQLRSQWFLTSSNTDPMQIELPPGWQCRHVILGDRILSFSSTSQPHTDPSQTSPSMTGSIITIPLPNSSLPIMLQMIAACESSIAEGTLHPPKPLNTPVDRDHWHLDRSASMIADRFDLEDQRAEILSTQIDVITELIEGAVADLVELPRTERLAWYQRWRSMAMKKVSERRSLWSVERDPPANSATATPRTDDLVSEILAIDRRLESPGPSSESAMENGAESVVLVAPTMVAGRALPILANREVSLLDRWRSELRSRPQTILACLGLLAVLLFLWMLHAWAWRRVHHQPWMAMTIWGVASLSLGSLAWVGVVGSIVAIFGLLLEHFSASRPTADRLGTKTQ